jgi:hypothetical protein
MKSVLFHGFSFLDMQAKILGWEGWLPQKLRHAVYGGQGTHTEIPIMSNSVS